MRDGIGAWGLGSFGIYKTVWVIEFLFRSSEASGTLAFKDGWVLYDMYPVLFCFDGQK
jgi:hypothetical protein